MQTFLWWVLTPLAALAVVGSIVLIARKFDGWTPSWPAWADRQTAGLVIGVIAIFLLLQVALPELIAAVVVAAGWFAIILVVVAVIALLTLLTGKQRAVIIWGIAALLLVIAFRGPSCAPGDTACIKIRQQAEAAETAQKREQRIAAAAEAAAIRDAQANPRCPDIKIPVTFGSAPIRVNPNANCSVDFFWEGEQCIFQKALGSNVVEGPFGDCLGNKGMRGVQDVEYAWSADKPFRGNYALVPQRRTTWFRQ